MPKQNGKTMLTEKDLVRSKAINDCRDLLIDYADQLIEKGNPNAGKHVAIASNILSSLISLSDSRE